MRTDIFRPGHEVTITELTDWFLGLSAREKLQVQRITANDAAQAGLLRRMRKRPAVTGGPQLRLVGAEPDATGGAA